MNRGIFITFEGIDGCGKSTQIGLLNDALAERGREVLNIREPGGTVVGEKIREVLLSKKNDSMTPVTELLLFVAARAQITREVIRPALEQGKVVICDRFFDSTYAYQGYARELGTETVKMLNETATEGLVPDITFFLDITPELAYQRRCGRDGAEDRMEALGLQFQQKVREGYQKIASESSRIRTIDASGPADEIPGEVMRHLIGLAGGEV